MVHSSSLEIRRLVETRRLFEIDDAEKRGRGDLELTGLTAVQLASFSQQITINDY